MRIELNKDLKTRLLKALQDGFIETSKFPELTSKGETDNMFLSLMKEATANQDDNKTKKTEL